MLVMGKAVGLRPLLGLVSGWTDSLLINIVTIIRAPIINVNSKESSLSFIISSQDSRNDSCFYTIYEVIKNNGRTNS